MTDGKAGGSRPPLTLLRESFSAVGARFHLVGLFTLSSLLVRFAVHWMGDDPDWILLFVAAVALRFACAAGIFGLLFQSATGGRESDSFVSWTARLLLPIVWVWVKILLVVFVPVGFAVNVYRVAIGSPTLPDRLIEIVFWSEPFLELAALVLSLYSFPLCVLWRARGQWGPHLRAGWRVLRARPAESRPLLLLLVALAAIEAAQQWTLGREGYKTVPGYAEGLLELAGSCLVLVVFFGATRVVLDRLAAEGPREAPAGAGGS